jgi:hypothetical protein
VLLFAPMGEFFQDFGVWFIAVLRKWYGWVGGSAAIGLVELLQAMKVWEHPNHKVYTFLLCFGFLVSFFQAWRDEYVPNRRQDQVRLCNKGKASAIDVGLSFSWPELSFLAPFEINVIHANGPEIAREAIFAETIFPGFSNAGHLGHILRAPRYRNCEPLKIIVGFFDSNRAYFERSFTCHPGHGGKWGPEVRISAGKSRRKRTKTRAPQLGQIVRA